MRRGHFYEGRLVNQLSTLTKGQIESVAPALRDAGTGSTPPPGSSITAVDTKSGMMKFRLKDGTYVLEYEVVCR